jgi:hypothetical protein
MILKLSLDLPEDQEYIHTTRLLSRTLLDDLRVVTQTKTTSRPSSPNYAPTSCATRNPRKDVTISS